MCQALGTDPARFWPQLRNRVRSYADLRPELVGAVERLIDFVAPPESLTRTIRRGRPEVVDLTDMGRPASRARPGQAVTAIVSSTVATPATVAAMRPTEAISSVERPALRSSATWAAMHVWHFPTTAAARQ